MVVIIPSFNNEKWCKGSLDSVFKQEYDNYRVIYINDASTDKTYDLVCDYIDEYDLHDRIMLIDNPENVGALANLYIAIHSCVDDEIIISLDGDDKLAHDYVLAIVNEAYADSKIWMAYSQFMIVPDNAKGWNVPCSKSSISKAKDRGQSPSHLRTFYAKLFKKIKLEDLMHEEYFFSMTWDMAIMLPMIEMARNDHIAFIPDVLYIYNNANPLNDHRKSKDLQSQLDQFIRGKKRYEPLKKLF